DLILLTVKAYDTASIADRIKHLLAPEGLVVSMQNGVGNLDVLVERFGSARAVAATMTAAGIPTEAFEDIAPLLWTKLFYNAALNPLGALLRLHYGALAADPDLRIVMNEVIEEAFAVAVSLNVPLPFESADAYRGVFYS